MNRHVIISFLLILGLLIPTSVNQVITLTYVRVGIGILLIFVIYLIVKQRSLNLYSIVALILTNAILLLFTMLSPLTEYRWLIAFYFFILTLIFCLDFKALKPDVEIYRKSLHVVNIIWIVLASSIIFGYEPVTTFLHNWYSAFYDDLLTIMFADKKPVTTFATHSIAAFYTFIFFLINFLTYVYLKKVSHLIISIIFIVFLFYIQSSTSVVYFVFSFVVIMVLFYRINKPIFFSCLTVGVVAGLVYYQQFNVFEMISNKLFSSNNGLSVRYDTNGGVLQESLNLIFKNPFRGFGYTYSSDFAYIDSGIIEYILRGSVFFLLVLFAGFFLFLKRNVGMKAGLFFLMLFLSFEVGFANFVYFRTLFILPFIIAYLAELRRTDKLNIKIREQPM